jgi:hypothetical protein
MKSRISEREFHTGAAPALPVPVCVLIFAVVVVFGARNAVVSAADW